MRSTQTNFRTDSIMKLKNRIAIVTGGGTGIGTGIVESLAAEGAHLVLAQRRVKLAEAVAGKLRRRGVRAIAIQCDMAKHADIKRLVATTVKKMGGIDIVVNNAGITGAPGFGSFVGQDKAHVDLVIDVNLKGPILLAQEAARVMIRQKRPGVIVNISSVAQFGAQEGASAYCASKAGLDGFCKTAALELAKYNIRVVNVAPGDIDVSAHHDIAGILKRSGVSGIYFKKTPLGRRGRAEEIGKVVAFAASDDASFVTGCTWLVDGGWMSY